MFEVLLVFLCVYHQIYQEKETSTRNYRESIIYFKDLIDY